MTRPRWDYFVQYLGWRTPPKESRCSRRVGLVIKTESVQIRHFDRSVAVVEKLRVNFTCLCSRDATDDTPSSEDEKTICLLKCCK